MFNKKEEKAIVNPFAEENAALREAVVEVFRFAICEMGWSWFRAEMLSGDDKQYQKSTEQNAEKVRQYLREIDKEHPILKTLIEKAHQTS